MSAVTWDAVVKGALALAAARRRCGRCALARPCAVHDVREIIQRHLRASYNRALAVEGRQ